MTDGNKANPVTQPGPGQESEVVQPDSGAQGAQVDTTGDAAAPAPAPDSPAGSQPDDQTQK